ncbi:hypothetical protein LF1_23350 [Rubripirellula obstinata]|uniref:Uncharacterized protein n=1 Tax=Rubripirellula obstinata TaxID=406547 RepID=A0A5B1CF51_9BACT|nr:hypothetical protein LF1_23350 [Rubripirellula obstinata]
MILLAGVEFKAAVDESFPGVNDATYLPTARLAAPSATPWLEIICCSPELHHCRNFAAFFPAYFTNSPNCTRKLKMPWPITPFYKSLLKGRLRGL